MKRHIALLLAFCMLLTSFPVSSVHANGAKEVPQGIVFDTSEGALKIGFSGGEPGEQGQPPRMLSRAFAPPVVCPSRAGDGLQPLGFLDESQVLLNEIHRCFSWGFPVRPALF